MKHERVFSTEREANNFAVQTGGHYFRTIDGLGKVIWIVIYYKEIL